MSNRPPSTPDADAARDRVVRVMRQLIAEQVVKDRQDFALRLSIAPARINAWENKKGHPTLQNFCDICKIFGVAGDYLLKGKGPAFKKDEDRLTKLERAVASIEELLKKR